MSAGGGVRRELVVVAALGVVAVGADLLLGAELPGRDAALGLVGCVLIIVVSKWLGARLIQRPEGYYEREEAADGPPAAGGQEAAGGPEGGAGDPERGAGGASDRGREADDG